ncbi:hypothetical protein ACIRST_07870 [Kitasatospora sp. NPDC101447]|uniref:hypothetical protein n=1 Tax=Kitasatospora sp. NPDC101447 TaxID=3364102 RepID=UPI00381872A5
MGWWNRKPEEERPQWVLDPLVGVGPLRFGMSPDEVAAALAGAVVWVARRAGGEPVRQDYHDLGVTAFFGPEPRLLAVAIDELAEPRVRLRGVELIARVPSEVRADLHELARRERVAVRENRSGDPEVAAWGVSMDTGQEWGRAPEGYVQRTSRAITGALLLGPELAGDPHGPGPVRDWSRARAEDAYSGTWQVTADEARPRWDCTPLEGVGPLRFGMSPAEVAAALGGEIPSARLGSHPWAGWPSPYAQDAQWNLGADVFDGTGVTAHYGGGFGAPALAAVTVHGRTGPRIEYAGIRLIGRPVADVDADIARHAEERDLGLRVTCAGDQGPDGTGIYVRAARAGDIMLSEARFCIEDWQED